MNRLALLLVLLMGPTHAAPVATATQDGVNVTLTDEKCAQSAVTNLPLRATWTEAGKSLDGCYTVQGGLAVLYFEDRTVVVVPVSMFKRATPV
jgi:hypothetical protein